LSPSSLLVRRFFFNNFHAIVHHPNQNSAVRMAAVSNICANFEEVGQVRAFNAPFFPLSLSLSLFVPLRALLFSKRKFDSHAILH